MLYTSKYTIPNSCIIPLATSFWSTNSSQWYGPKLIFLSWVLQLQFLQRAVVGGAVGVPGGRVPESDELAGSALPQQAAGGAQLHGVSRRGRRVGAPVEEDHVGSVQNMAERLHAHMLPGLSKMVLVQPASKRFTLHEDLASHRGIGGGRGVKGGPQEEETEE